MEPYDEFIKIPFKQGEKVKVRTIVKKFIVSWYPGDLDDTWFDCVNGRTYYSLMEYEEFDKMMRWG